MSNLSLVNISAASTYWPIINSTMDTHDQETSANVTSNETSTYFYDNIKEFMDYGGLEDVYKMMRLEDEPEIFILTAVLSLFFIVGTIGNIIVICVFSRSIIKHTSTYFLLTLAIVDLIICTVVLPGVLIKNWSYPFKVDAICKIWEFIRMSTVPVSALTLMAIGFDRFYLICMASEGPLSTSFAKLIIAAIVLSGMSLGTPPMLGVGVYQRGDDLDEITYLGLCMPNTLLISSDSLEEYWKVIVTIICTIFVFLVVMYSLIFCKVYRQNQKWRSLKRNKVHPVADVQKYENDPKLPQSKWNRIRHIIPSRDKNGRIFFVKVRPLIVRPPNLSHEESDPRGQGDSGVGSTENSRVSRSPSLNDTNKLAESTETIKPQEYSYGRQRRAHIKTAKVLCIVSIIYICSYSPPLLMSADLISSDCIYLFYTYFIHSAVNPLIYSFMNKKFRSEAYKLLFCKGRR